jgi:PadR family transcriptional regulator, regulatory protein PadR
MSVMNPSIKRGSAELAVLSVLEDGPLHGYEIARRIEADSGGVLQFTLASLYPLLYRMEHLGWTTAAWETTTSGVKRRCYRLTASGRKQLAHTRREWDSFFRAITRVGGLSRA